MKDNSLSKLGETCSILLAVSYVLAGVGYLLQPAELQAGPILSSFGRPLPKTRR